MQKLITAGWFIIVATLIGAALLAFTAYSASAACFKPESLDTATHNAAGQRLTYTGRTKHNEVLRVYHDAETGEWTMTLVRKDGDKAIECEISDGEAWRGPVVEERT